MNKKEAAVIGAYTGILCGDFSDLHKYIEDLMGRPVFTHEMGNRSFQEELKKTSKPDFLDIVKNLTD